MKKLILLLFIPLISFSQEKEFDFSNLERVPIYPGCEVNMKQLRNCFQKKIQTHINKNFRYPIIAQRKKIQGRVFVQFIIGTGGYIDQIKARGPDPMLEDEAIRIVSLIPKLMPGIVDGKAVRVPFSIPITFKLSKWKLRKNEKTYSTIMKRDTYYILSFSIIGLALIGGRYLGLSFIERVIAASVFGGLFELIYRKQLKKWKN